MEENKQDKKPEKIEPEGDAECLILKDTAPAESKESVYEEVEDDDELDIVAGMFEEALGDTEIVG